MKAERDLKTRTKAFAEVLGIQILRSATSVGAQYREAQRAKSNADFISKIEGAQQELEETEYWLELLGESGLVSEIKLQGLKEEANHLLAIFVSIVKKTKLKARMIREKEIHPSSRILQPLSKEGTRVLLR
jgi:four helix bundle protein